MLVWYTDNLELERNKFIERSTLRGAVIIMINGSEDFNFVLLRQCCLVWSRNDHTNQAISTNLSESIEYTDNPTLLFHHCAFFYHIRAKERANYAAQNKPNFALFTCKARKFSISSPVTFSILTNQINNTLMVSLVLFMSGFRKLKAKILENGGMVE